MNSKPGADGIENLNGGVDPHLKPEKKTFEKKTKFDSGAANTIRNERCAILREQMIRE